MKHSMPADILRLRTVLDSLIRDHGVHKILYQLEFLCRQKAKKIPIDDTPSRAARGEWETAAEELSSTYTNLIELNLLY